MSSQGYGTATDEITEILAGFEPYLIEEMLREVMRRLHISMLSAGDHRSHLFSGG